MNKINAFKLEIMKTWADINTFSLTMKKLNINPESLSLWF